METVTLSIAEITNNQPFCAGVVLTRENGVLVTLNTDGLPQGMEHTAWRVGGVGGGQEPGETVWDCALREAKEELSTEVSLLHSPVTYFHDKDTGQLQQISVTDHPAPLLLERITNPNPSKPYAPGLPTGPYIYFALFLGELEDWSKVWPGDDVKGLLLCPIDLWHQLERVVELSKLVEVGAKVIGPSDLDLSRRLWLPQDESFSVVVRILKEKRSILEK
jgi:8-oxo-dGTP pyrophosphatase MutT (NUDIX family)